MTLRHEPWTYKPSKTQLLVCIIGQNPGKSREKNKKAFIGNRSGDYVQELVKKHKLENVFFTNVSNYEIMNDTNTRQGIAELERWLKLNRPEIIVTLGKIAETVIKGYKEDYDKIVKGAIFHLPHPSYVLRFNLVDEKEQFERLFECIEVAQHENAKHGRIRWDPSRMPGNSRSQECRLRV